MMPPSVQKTRRHTPQDLRSSVLGVAMYAVFALLMGCAVKPAQHEQEVARQTNDVERQGASAETRGELSVLTWNIWGLESISPELDRRVAKMPGAIAELDADVVLLQEVWRPEDAQTIESGLREAGYTDVRSFVTRPEKAGLMIATKLPIANARFRRFESGRYAHTPWHLDWYADKGLAIAELSVHGRRLCLSNTHFHARYETDDYSGVRLVQSIEAIDAIASCPLLVASGDWNTVRSDLPRRVLRAHGLFAEVEQGIDAVLSRTGPAGGYAIVDVQRVLGEKVDLGGGISLRLSDHQGLLAKLRFDTERLRPDEDLSGEIDAALETERQSTRLARVYFAIATVLLLMLTALSVWRFRKARSPFRKTKRLTLVGLGVVSLIVGGFLVYVTTVQVSVRLSEFDLAEQLLSSRPANPRHR